MNLIKITCLFFSFSLLAQSPKSNKEKSNYSSKGKSVTVYSSADNSTFRLTQTDQLFFVSAVQPLETETCVFVEPRKTFQTFLGIGGAITDASAEVFAKLPKNKHSICITKYITLTNYYFLFNFGISTHFLFSSEKACFHSNFSGFSKTSGSRFAVARTAMTSTPAGMTWPSAISIGASALRTVSCTGLSYRSASSTVLVR
jgi:hypothetical protein